MVRVFVDVDECLVNKGDCDENATCVNHNGGHCCVCDHGYEQAGQLCNSKY